MDKTSLIGKKFGRLTVLSFAEGYEKSHFGTASVSAELLSWQCGT